MAFSAQGSVPLRREVASLQLAAARRVSQLNHHIREERKLAKVNRALTKENEVLAKDLLKAYAANRALQQKNQRQGIEMAELQEALRIAGCPGIVPTVPDRPRPICISQLEIQLPAFSRFFAEGTGRSSSGSLCWIRACGHDNHGY
jgi:hypothetical protein